MISSSQYISSAMQKKSSLPTIFIIGGGVGGCGTALKLAEQGYPIVLFEKYQLFSGSSSKTPGRMGLGFHYVDEETAIMYLKATIAFQKEFPGFRIGETQPTKHPLRCGRYFITKDSLFSPKQILATFEKIKIAYKELVAEDPTNEVFGSPDNLYRILKLEEYADEVNLSNVAVGIETAEHLLDWNKFSVYLKERLLSDKNITVHENTEVMKIERGQKERFILTTQKGRFCGNWIINAAWEDIEKINAQLGFKMLPDSRTNRVKILLKVALPKTLQGKHSMFFCMGPHCMFSNVGDGYGMMTYAKVTNEISSTDLELSERAKGLLSGKASTEEKISYANQIRAGVSGYIPAMREAKIIDVKFGVVKTLGKVDIFRHDSPFHKRNYYGVIEQQIGLISNHCMKLLYLLENAKIIISLLESQRKISAEISETTDEVIAKIVPLEGDPKGEILKSILVSHLTDVYSKDNTDSKDDTESKESYIGPPPLKIASTLTTTMESKLNLNKIITTMFAPKTPETKTSENKSIPERTPTITLQG